MNKHSVFATKGIIVTTTYHFKGVEIDKNLVMRISGAHYWKMCTEESITTAGIEIRTTEIPKLVATTPCDYSGYSLPEFTKEECGLIYFHKQYGDRPAGFELRARVAEEIGKVVVLHEWEERNFYCKGWGPEYEPIFRDWKKIDLNGKSFTRLVW